MSPDLIALLIMGVYTAIVCYIAYWRGYSKGRRETADLYLDELDAATEALAKMAAKQRHPSRRFAPLTDAELDSFLRQLKAES